MASNSEYEQKQFWDENSKICPENGWVTIKLESGNTYTYNKKFWDIFLDGDSDDISKLTSNT